MLQYTGEAPAQRLLGGAELHGLQDPGGGLGASKVGSYGRVKSRSQTVVVEKVVGEGCGVETSRFAEKRPWSGSSGPVKKKFRSGPGQAQNLFSGTGPGPGLGFDPTKGNISLAFE